MINFLRLQLLEAITDAISTNNQGKEDIVEYAEAALDTTLSFLSENAEVWIRAAHLAGNLDDGMERGDHALVDPLIAALLDANATKEKLMNNWNRGGK